MNKEETNWVDVYLRLRSAMSMPEAINEFVKQARHSVTEMEQEYTQAHSNKIELPISGNFLNWVNRTAGYYGHPVYLVGSQITGSKTPRDVDIVCPIPDKEFELRFGSVDDWMQEGGTGLWTDVRWKWASRCAKDSLDGMKETKLQIDFKVQPMALFNGYSYVHKAFPPVRLDTGKFDYEESISDLTKREYFTLSAPKTPNWYIHKPAQKPQQPKGWDEIKWANDEEKELVRSWAHDGIFDLPDHLMWFQYAWSDYNKAKTEWDKKDKQDRYFQWRIYYADALIAELNKK